MANKQAINWLKKYLRFTDYVGASQLYLKENALLKEKLIPKHFKKRILGHWGTVPGINLIYGALNYLIAKEKCEMLLVTGPGHGAPAVLANLFLEGTLKEFYKQYSLDEKGITHLIKDFSWPYSPFPSHVTPTVPGSILEGGELGYSLSTAFGAVMDNPNLIATAIVGDGEAESGPLATAWHSNKFLNPRTSGAVLPIIHVNSYKISNLTIYGSMDDSELKLLFQGYGYEPIFVKGPNLEGKTLDAVEKAYKLIRATQKKARASKSAIKPKWPVIILRSPKGWKGPKTFKNKAIENSFRSHGIPFEKPQTDQSEFTTVEKWLKSYKIGELIEKNGSPKKEILAYVPKGKLRIGMCKHAIGGTQLEEIKVPKLAPYEIKFKKRGSGNFGSVEFTAALIRDMIKANPKNFRIFCPDEIESNKLGKVFEVTNREYQWPITKNTEFTGPQGRVFEMLSEHTLQGWLQGYLLTGRHGMFVTYEAFAPIIASMVDQYAKFLKQSFNVKWRKPLSSAVYLLSSTGWRQDHNGFSHQNPSFVSSVLQKHGEFCQIYYPADANALLLAYEEAFKRKNSIAVIVAGKRDMPIWQTLKEAREQAKNGLGVWEWVGGKEASQNPDVVLASAGDYITQEAILAVKMCQELIPEVKVRYVNISELTSLSIGDYCIDPKSCLTREGLNQYFTKDKPVIISYHGYINDLEQILWPYTNNTERFTLRGYTEFGSTTTPFDMKIRSRVSCFHLAQDIICQAAKTNPAIKKKKDKLMAEIQEKITNHQNFIVENGDDPDEIKNMSW